MLIEDEATLAEICRNLRTVAVVGMKDERSAGVPAFDIPQRLQKQGLRVFPVNPFIQHSLGEPAFPSLASLGRRVDLIDVFRRSAVIPALAEEIIALPDEQYPDVVWLQSGIRDDDAARRLGDAGIRVVMDRCLAVYASRYR